MKTALLVLLPAVVLGAGCASLQVYDEPAPAAMGPAAGEAVRPAQRVATHEYHGRSPGWDAPDDASTSRAAGGVTAAPLVMSESFMAVQVMLDRANFSPGCIDGRPGTQSRLALLAWQKREGWPATGEVDPGLLAHLATLGDPFTQHTVTAADHDGLATVPDGWRAKAQLTQLSHTTVQERLAEQYHLSQRSLKELNPAISWPNPAVGTVLRVPRVMPYPKTLAGRIEIHLAGKYMQVFDYEDRLIAHFPCSIARDKEKRPVGELHIVNAAENPNYTFKPELFSGDPEVASIGGSLLIPPGPNNPVGVAWLSLDRPGYGIHGTPKPEEIGRTESHGCFRLANWNARKLMGMVTIGVPVLVYE